MARTTTDTVSVKCCWQLDYIVITSALCNHSALPTHCCSDRGKLSCIEAVTGKLLYRESLSSSSAAVSASPVAADGKIYCTAENGDIYVVEAGPEFKLIGVNKMNETCMATPAISRGTLFFRTRHNLVAVAEHP